MIFIFLISGSKSWIDREGGRDWYQLKVASVNSSTYLLAGVLHKIFLKK